MTEDARSAEACPRCGAHRVAVIDFPDVSTLGYQVFAESIGFREPRDAATPGIGCLACGAEWPDLDTFREEQGSDRSRGA